MKKLILITVLLFSLLMAGQENNKIAVKTINKEKTVVGYLIIYINKEHKAVKTIRVNSYSELKRLNVMRKANGYIKTIDIPLDKLIEGEYLKNGVKE